MTAWDALLALAVFVGGATITWGILDAEQWLWDRPRMRRAAKLRAATPTQLNHPGPCSIACQADHWPRYRYTGWSEPCDESKMIEPDPENFRGLRRS